MDMTHQDHRAHQRRRSSRKDLLQARSFLYLSLRGMLACASVALGLAGCARCPVPPFAESHFYATGGHFTVIGDLQRTLPEERLFCGRENNDLEREQLLPEVARTSPTFVVMLGDLVSWGSSTSQWEEFDRRSEELRRKSIPVLAVPGNHDYYGGDRLRQYFARLPYLQGQHWYERRYRQLGLIFLDSNVGPLSGSQWSAQREWYESTLTRLDADSTVLGILVFLHHAPFTNSSGVDDDNDVCRTFVQPFRAKKKTLMMVTGHAHGYERFEDAGKSFVVTGGGGGPRIRLLTGNERRHDDKFEGPDIRNFNFVEFSTTARGLHMDVVGLPKGGHRKDFCRMERLDVPWPETPLANTTQPPDEPSGERDLRDCYEHQAPKSTSASTTGACCGR